MKTTETKKTPIYIMIIIGILIWIAILNRFCSPESGTKKITTTPETTETKPTISLTQEQTDILIKLEKDGYIVLEPQNNTVYIDPSLWSTMDYKLKEDMGASFAIYCATKRNDDLIYVTIYDKMSGKKLAKYSNSWGFTVY
jgi:hypothetical protein